MKKSILLLSGIVASVQFAGSVPVDPPSRAWGDWPKWGDQGDGTYNNPVIPSDYSDLDCIRVGNDYYAISSTFQFSPGMVILHSNDLVNWTILGHAVDDLTPISSAMNWTEMNRYGKGIWAGAIRYHDKKFWLYFGTPDEGYFMTTASNPAGPWEPLHPVIKSGGWDDCCPFWDDDGQGYFVGTNYTGPCTTYLWKLTPDGKDIIPESRVSINEGAHREANKFLKINGWYYHLFSEVNGGARVVMMQRSKTITGPYTERRQLTAKNREEKEPNQGGLVDNGKGAWYFLTHHGSGSWEGRCVSLLPVTWIDGWPIMGETHAAGEPGKMSWSGKLPVPGGRIVTPQGSDDFTASLLAPQWEWNYQPRAGMWSLKEKPGFLRLKAYKPLKADDLMKAGNTLTQRCFRTTRNEVITKMDLSGMADGQKAGLCHFAGQHSALGVSQEGAARTLEFRLNGKNTPGPAIKGNDLWLRSSWGIDGKSQYAFSTDGRNYQDFGETYQLDWGHYRGDRIGIYNFNNKTEAGVVDVDYLIYNYAGPVTKTGTR